MAITKAQRRIEQMAALAAEQREYEKRVKAATKRAAFARCEAVEQLYELLGVSEEPTTPRVVVRDGTRSTTEVSSDRDESKRAARLVAAVDEVLVDHERLRAALAEASGSTEGALAAVADEGLEYRS
ncbi:hypothetical protein [Brachybacterium sp. UNK5269]|uniref:hypothetical protein n=1 Tax=Brachybacterium sp. UNK5269 TaxID=3408576 RepID=UPI003BB0E443